MKRSKLRYGMVGGDLNAFIGDVHRKGAAMNENVELVAGCFSRREEANRATGLHYGLDPERIYADFETMAAAEAAREDGIDWVSICTPNNTHYQAAKAFLENGINVYCEKPLTFTAEEALELKRLAEEKGLLFGLNYSHSGNVMVHEARALVHDGVIGEIINVNGEYFQEYLVDDIGNTDKEMLQLSSWRKDPAISGGSNCVGDIGSHIEHTVSFITGLELKRVCAMLDNYGQPLDLNANILVEFDNGCHGVFSSSQVCVGHLNGLVVRIFGTKGAIEWVQETPNVLKLTLKGQPTQILNRGMGYIHPDVAAMERLPFGHPEGLYEAFANMYSAFTAAVLKKVNGEELTEADLDYPNIEDGIRGVRFIAACLKSNAEGSVWTEV
ncbi:MAG: Gfo/Idh/MocA family oxidoreductase [Firmicutes bacterium]|nr:Gfo/Idh/MocA family oxidoreductase [Bacillota bacterium]